jgi:hypothetical protein
MATFNAMKVANQEIKKQYGKIDVDKIEVPKHHANQTLFIVDVHFPQGHAR